MTLTYKLVRLLVSVALLMVGPVSCRTVMEPARHAGSALSSGSPGTEQDCPETSHGEGRQREVARPLDLSDAIKLHARGRVDEALAAALHLLNTVTALQLESPSLRLLIAEWAIELGNGVLAEEQLQAALSALSAEEGIALEVSRQLRVAQSLAYGSDVVALEEARALFEGGEWKSADEHLKKLFAQASDEDVLGQGEALRETIYRESVARVEAALVRADALLSQDWTIAPAEDGPTGSETERLETLAPADEVEELLASIEALPLDTWLPAEVASRRTLLSKRLASSSMEAQVVLEREWEATLDEARALVAANRYRDARSLYATLEGSPHQRIARSEAAMAADSLVKEERLRAGRLFVVARKTVVESERAVQLREVRDLLSSLLEEFPKSRYADRVADNLATVEAELAKLSVE